MSLCQQVNCDVLFDSGRFSSNLFCTAANTFASPEDNVCDTSNNKSLFKIHTFSFSHFIIFKVYVVTCFILFF